MSLSLHIRFWRFVLRKVFKEQRLTIAAEPCSWSANTPDS